MWWSNLAPIFCRIFGHIYCGVFGGFFYMHRNFLVPFVFIINGIDKINQSIYFSSDFSLIIFFFCWYLISWLHVVFKQKQKIKWLLSRSWWQPDVYCSLGWKEMKSVQPPHTLTRHWRFEKTSAYNTLRLELRGCCHFCMWNKCLIWIDWN